jgi:putative intracellular protease/amidase
MAPKILVVLTSADKLPLKPGHTTGWFLPELAHPYDVLAPKAELVFASPKGGVAPLDPGSVEMFKEDPSSSAFFANKKSLWENTAPLKDFVGRAGEFDAIFYPGGHGPMIDLVDDAESIKLIQEFWAAGKPVSAVCHGPAVFTNVEVDGQPLLKGRQATGFSNAEEDAVQLSEFMPFMLETRMKERGAKYVVADEPWGAKVVTDGKLITGQNPNSAKGVGEAILAAISA